MKIKELFESPYLNDEELPYVVLAKISASALKRAYVRLGDVDDITVFAKRPAGFIAGRMINGHCSCLVQIMCRTAVYPRNPTQLSNFQQVSMVRVDEKSANSGITKLIYNFIGKHTNIVSDQEQFLGAKGLWKSLARESDINVYVFDCTENDYVRKDGAVVKYDAINISERKIWGTTHQHKNMLLVATSKILK